MRTESHASIKKQLLESARVKRAMVDKCVDAIEKGTSLIADALSMGRKVLLCGNGGSAADCQHIAAELVGRFSRDRGALPAIALTTDSSLLTAVANDFSFDSVFERQVEALGNPGDVLIGISTSGNSQNVVLAIQAAKTRGLRTIVLGGKIPGAIAGLSDIEILVPSDKVPRIQEGHITIAHIMCDLVEKKLFE